MPTTVASSPRRRRLLTAVVVAVSVVAVPLTTGAPAGAATAPLVTTEGIGIRIDENAIVGPVLEDLENNVMEPFMEQRVVDGALVHTGIIDPDQVDANLNLELSFDFVNAGTTGYPQGGLLIDAVVTSFRIRTTVYGPWWLPVCVLNADASTPLVMDASSRVDATALPATPFAALPTTNSWPSATVSESVALGYSSTCIGYVTAPFDWAGFSDLTDPTSTASVIQAELEAQLQDLANDLWSDNVEAVVSSLTTLAGFGVSYNQIRTDTNGLVATADVDTTAGLTVYGSGPYSVTGAQAAGVTVSTLNTVLAQRSLGTVATDAIVSLHPNVTNQYLSAVHDYWGGSYDSGTWASSALGTALINPSYATCYSPDHWWTYMDAQAAPYVTPTGTGGAPRMQLPLTTVQFYNDWSCDGWPVATFTGSLYDIPVTVTGAPVGPRGSASTAFWTATRTSADVAVTTRTPAATATTLRPWAREALGTFLASVPGHIDMTPGAFPGQTVSLCTTCGRVTGDQRITAGFQFT